ncbi:MAG: SpoIIE family protein phosphatase [Acidobacteriota bacterium]|nr:MAG: SpoIIE family protein phosphatase [Acidobacteriota bacterium]
MNTRRLLLLLPVAVGSLALFLLFPRLDPSAHWNYAIDRTRAIDIARRELSALGFDTAGWDEKVTIRYNSTIFNYLKLEPNPIGAGVISPLITSAHFRDLRANKRLNVDLNAAGKMTGLSLSSPEDKTDQTNGTPIANQPLAEDFAKKVLGQQFSRFTLSDAGSQEGNNRRLSWVASDERMRVTVRVETRGERVAGLSIEPVMTAGMRNELSGRRSRVSTILSGVGLLVFLPAALLIAIFYFTGLARRQIHHPTTMVFLLGAFLLTFGTSVVSEFADSLILNTTFSTGTVGYWVALLAPRILFLFIMLGIAFTAYVTWSAGQALALRAPNRRTLSFELLLKGKVLTRPVTEGLAAGLSFGALLAALPYLVLATGLFPTGAIETSDAHAYFAAQFPSIAALTTGDELAALVLFAFAGSLIDSTVRRRALATGLMSLVTLLGVLSFQQIGNSAPAMIINGVLMTALLLWLYYSYGALAAVTSVICSQAALNAAAMILQPSLDLSGWAILICLGLGLMAGLVALARSREVTPEEVAVPDHLISGRIERERLKAEFEVARRAQIRMLPDSEPVLEGLDISAVCRPSREVGGDLYDFLNMKDGRLGIVVADVSGKGVPASLYMTLTKGLLDSVSEVETDPGQILREVNRHLYDVCRRKVFVTLFLGIIDPVSRRFEFARAGHNPPVLFSPGDNRTQLLKPRGMGLGLNSGRIFDQSIQVDSIDLNPGDLLLIYSDGITEAMNFKKEEFGEERLEAIAGNLDGYKAQQARDAVMTEVSRFLGNIPPQDDQTLVVLRVESKK